jgi:large conductance mechanosensitive channel
MLKEFKEFALKGNMLDMAVGIVIGAAFGTVIKSLVDDLLMPLIASIFGTPDFSNLFILLKEPMDTAGVNMDSIAAVREAGGIALGWGLFINALIAFILVALALYVVVRNMNKLNKKEEEAAPAPAGPTQEELLTEIRDALKSR